MEEIQMEEIQVVTATNNLYAEHLAVMLLSLLDNKKSKNPITIFVIDSDISKENIKRMKKLAQKYGAKIHFKKVDSEVYADFMTFAYLTKETYYRFSIPNLLKDKIQKVIYLDSDVIVKSDITKLWNTKIDDYYLGAVEDCWVKDSRNNDLKMPSKSKYFNAGVLLINLKKWRENKVTDKIISFIKKNASNIKYCSQDPINAVLHDKWLALDPKWNYQTNILSYPELKIKPAIIHYTGGNKPWNSQHPLKNEYLKYRKNLPKPEL